MNKHMMRKLEASMNKGNWKDKLKPEPTESEPLTEFEQRMAKQRRAWRKLKPKDRPRETYKATRAPSDVPPKHDATSKPDGSIVAQAHTQNCRMAGLSLED